MTYYKSGSGGTVHSRSRARQFSWTGANLSSLVSKVYIRTVDAISLQNVEMVGGNLGLNIK